MSQVRLYLDEDAMRRSLIFGLRARNVDVLTAAEADIINRRDEDHLTAAAAAGRALLTYNTADYCALHQGWTCRAGYLPALEAAWRLGNTVVAKLAGELEGVLQSGAGGQAVIRLTVQRRSGFGWLKLRRL